MLPLGVLAAVGSAKSYELISTSVVTGGSTSNISFSNIPQFYKHLQLRITMRGTLSGSENLYMRFNNTTYTYAGHALYGQGTTVISNNYTGANFADMPAIPTASNSSGIFGAYIVDILDYASTTKNKTLKTLGGFVGGSNQLIQLRSNLMISTDAITAIHQIGGTSGQPLVAGTRVSLYGVRG